MLMELIFGNDLRHARLTQLTYPLCAQQIFISNDIAPVVLARVMHTHKDVCPASQHGQHFKGLLR
ncbi:hypothetical protein SRABI106_02610 [Rahnella aquatilis]|nr:hypothetical protein SRABI106_02610 [Rahnella aquatilis]